MYIGDGLIYFEDIDVVSQIKNEIILDNWPLNYGMQ